MVRMDPAPPTPQPSRRRGVSRARGLFQHTPEAVLECVVEPAAALPMRLSRAVRRFQHGRVQSYLLYTVVGATVLALLVWLGAP